MTLENSTLLAQLCESMHVDVQTVLNTWEYLCTIGNIDDAEPSTPEHFVMIRSELSRVKPKASRIQVKNAPKIRKLNQLNTDQDFLKPSTPLKDIKNSQSVTTPKSLQNTPTKPSPFTTRTSKFSLVSSFNPQIPFIPSNGNGANVSLAHELQPYRYGMYKVDGDELNERIEYFENEFNENAMNQDEKEVLVGMICSDSLEVQKLNPNSCILQTSRTNYARLRLNLEKIESVALFPGQIVQVEGTRIDDTFHCTNINVPDMLDKCVTQVEDLKDNPGQLEYVLAAGPYTLTDSLEYEPLQELIDFILEKKPNLVVLMGPFVSEEHPMIVNGQTDMSLEQIYSLKVAPKLNLLKQRLDVQLIIIPSTTDILSDTPCMPQPAFKMSGLHQSVLNFSNPVQFTVNHTLFAITSEDVVTPLSAFETVKQSQQSQDRMSRLVKHILSQRTFTPMFPFPFKSFNSVLNMIATPDILVLPSVLKPFVKNVDGCIVINPGSCCKAASSGTFIHGIIHPFDQEALESISEESVLGMVAERMRVDIIKL